MTKFVAVGLTALLCWAGTTLRAAEEKPTFAEQIAPLVFNNCTSCHRPGEAAPFSLLSYNDVRKHSRTMLRVMQRRYMPPWQPEPGYGEFQHERRLSDDQIALFRRWVEAGMAEGDPQKAPAPPTFSAGWSLGKPDLVVTMDRAYDVAADGPDVYRNFVFRLNLPEDKWVTAVEIRPSAREVVHHALFFTDATGSARKLEGKDGQPGFTGMSFRRTGGLGGWAVGATPTKLPGGLAWPLPKDADLVVQTHFHPSGKPEKEVLTLGLYFADKPPTRTMVNVQLPPAFGLFAGVNIPPGKADYTVKDSFTLPVDVELVGAGAHAHLLGKSLKGWAVLPNGETKQLFWIKDWDFNWHGAYYYKQPVRLPKGTVLHGEVTWDNSADNVRNPHQPPVRVEWGEGTTDEMGSVRFAMTAADDKEAPVLQSAVKAQVRAAYIDAMLRGDKIDFKKLGGGPDRKPADAPKPSPAKTSKVSDAARLLAVESLDGKKLQPLGVKDAKACVLFFIAADCSISNSYAPEINTLVKEYGEQSVRFYVIHVDADLTPEAARKHAEAYGYRCPVLLDSHHQLVAATGVTATPEVAVVTPDGTIAYRGRIDDLYSEIGVKRQTAAKRDLREALVAVLADKAALTARTKAVGCVIPDLP
jgi:mono/diheme cytochrome c family protein/peroxiredoxin